jgi:hypothetical protein
VLFREKPATAASDENAMRRLFLPLRGAHRRRTNSAIVVTAITRVMYGDLVHEAHNVVSRQFGY